MFRPLIGIDVKRMLLVEDACKTGRSKMKELGRVVFVAIGLLGYAVSALAVTLNDEYSISSQITQISLNSYSFDYFVTNNNQSVNSSIQPVGLDGFSVAIPDSALISNITNPPLFTNVYAGGPSFWESSIATVNNTRYIDWFGFEWNSIYPVGTTAHFSFVANNVDVGTVPANVITFWNTNPIGELSPNGAYYTTYQTSFLGPVAIPSAVPEPSTLLLFSTGAFVVGLMRRRKRAVRLS